LRTVISRRFPLNSLKAIKNPAGIPIVLAIRVERELTLKETYTIWRSSWSSSQRSRKADRKLSVRKSNARLSLGSFSMLDVGCGMWDVGKETWSY
jgi:hypothetical protein